MQKLGNMQFFLQIYLCTLFWLIYYYSLCAIVMSILVSNCQHYEEQQSRTLSLCTLPIFSVVKSNLFIQALLLDRILVTEKTTRTPRVHLVRNCCSSQCWHMDTIIGLMYMYLGANNLIINCRRTLLAIHVYTWLINRFNATLKMLCGKSIVNRVTFKLRKCPNIWYTKLLVYNEWQHKTTYSNPR